MASPKSRRRSRKRRTPAAAPRAVPSTRQEARTARVVSAERERRRAAQQFGPQGERPESPFGGLPISELAILVGFIALVFGFIRGGGPAVVVGIVICALGVVEVTAREHFTGFRSHAALLAAIPAVALEATVVAIFGEPRQHAFLLLIGVPVFAVLFWLLRRKFLAARQVRIARPPAP